MVDHLLTFASEAAAHTALDPLGYGSSGTIWDTSRCIPNVAIVTAEAVFSNGVLVTPAVVKPNWWIMVSLPSLDSTLQGLSGSISAIFDRDAGTRVFVTPNVIRAIALSSIRIAPVFCGSQYTFGV